MDQQQLQIARAALWHQTAATDPSAPLRTFEQATAWLDDTGLCLFLPRHTQLPAPAPSFVEACLGAASVTPPPPAIEQATELLIRLISERKVVPLNLLGTFSEQPDFLVTLDVLPWLVAVRGDRQWKTAPGGRTAPIVLRTFEALDREGELTAIELREILGREVTEAAVLRALIELWTGVRAMPIYTGGAATRWTLLKNRCATQLATAANIAQTTALSALLSLYLRSAVAATAEEAEVFLSPLTARSRIREVVHGMMATRQLMTTPVATQTLLFVEGSLPETAAAPEATPEPRPERRESAPAPAARPGRAPFRKAPRPTRWELPAANARPQADESRPWQKKPAAPHRKPVRGAPERERSPRDQSGAERPRREARPSGSRPASRPGSASGPRRGFGQRFGQGAGKPGGPGSRPWKPRRQDSFGGKTLGTRKFDRRDRGPSPEGAAGTAGETRPPQETYRPKREQGAATFRKDRPFRKEGTGGKPGGFKREARPGTGARSDRPWQKRPPFRESRPARPEGSGERRPARPFRPGKPFAGKPGAGKSTGPRPTGENRSARPPRPFRPGKPFAGKPAGPRPTGENRSARPARPFRPGKPFAGKPGPRADRGSRPGRPVTSQNKFRKPLPTDRKPRKNRNQKETPE